MYKFALFFFLLYSNFSVGDELINEKISIADYYRTFNQLISDYRCEITNSDMKSYPLLLAIMELEVKSDSDHLIEALVSEKSLEEIKRRDLYFEPSALINRQLICLDKNYAVIVKHHIEKNKTSSYASGVISVEKYTFKAEGDKFKAEISKVKYINEAYSLSTIIDMSVFNQIYFEYNTRD